MTELSDIDIANVIRAERRQERETIIAELERFAWLRKSLSDAIRALKDKP